MCHVSNKTNVNCCLPAGKSHHTNMSALGVSNVKFHDKQAYPYVIDKMFEWSKFLILIEIYH